MVEACRNRQHRRLLDAAHGEPFEPDEPGPAEFVLCDDPPRLAAIGEVKAAGRRGPGKYLTSEVFTK